MSNSNRLRNWNFDFEIYLGLVICYLEIVLSFLFFLKWLRDHIPGLIFEQDLHLSFRLLQPSVADTGQFDPLFEQFQRLLQSEISLLKFLDYLLQPRQRCLEPFFRHTNTLPSLRVRIKKEHHSEKGIIYGTCKKNQDK